MRAALIAGALAAGALAGAGAAQAHRVRFFGGIVPDTRAANHRPAGAHATALPYLGGPGGIVGQ